MKSNFSVGSLPRNRWFRLTLGIAAAFWFVWLGVEDQGTITVLLLAAAMITPMALLGYQHLIAPLPHVGKRRFVSILFVGLLGGLLIAPMAILLMAVKTSLHNHGIPDFSRTEVINVLYSTPAWTVGALLLAAAGALYDRVQAD
jgi:hypothetical protein